MIDLARVKIAAEQAQIASLSILFLMAMQVSLENEFASVVVNDNVALRALYKKSSLIVFDEATSAGITTEKNVMESVESLSRDLTIVMIAHRLNNAL